MKKLIAASFCIFSFVKICTAQQTFNKIFYKNTGTLTYFQNNNTVKTFGGGYAYTESNGSNAYVTIFDSIFNMIWAKNINIASNHKSSGLSIAQSTADSTYLMLGVTSDPQRPEYDMLISRIDQKGNEISTNSYLLGSSQGGYSKVIALPNGKFIAGVDIGGQQVGLIQLNKNGKITSAKNITYAGSVALLFSELIPTNDSGFMIAGNVMYDNGVGKRDIFCTKLDSNLSIKWTKLYSTGNTEEVSGIIQTKDSGYVMYGYYQNGDPTTQTRLAKISKDGNVEWNKVYHFASNAFPSSAVQVVESGYAFAGFDIFKTDNQGEIQWVSNQYLTNATNPIFQTPDNGFLTFSQIESFELNAIKLDSAGTSCFPYYEHTYTELTDNLSVSDASFILTATSVSDINSGSVFAAADTTSFYYCQTVLPLQLLSFTANHYNSQNVLHWKTAEEINTAQFEIERSADGNLFKALNIIKAKGANGNTYTYYDVQPLTATNFYRLKMIDKDGSFTYSNTCKLNNKSSIDITLYPNPVKNNLSILLNSKSASGLETIITDINGKILYSYNFLAILGQSNYNINISSLAKGIYFLKISSKNKQETLKFIKE